MKRFSILSLMLAAMIAGSSASAQNDSDGFVPLFNGEDLTGWDGDSALWAVEAGAIVGTTDGSIRQNTFLSTTKAYGNFVLRVKTKLRNGNSGIQFRSEQRPKYSVAGYQADLAEKTYFGMLYEEQKRGILKYWRDKTPEEQAAIHALGKQGDWNQFVVTCLGDYIKIELNGVTTCEMRDPSGAREGIIALQLHVGPAMQVSFKDLEIREFKPDAQVSDIDASSLLMPDVEARRERFAYDGSRFRTPEGFIVEEVATNELIGSVINLDFDHKGRPVVASEPNGMRILIDEDEDGLYESQKVFSDDVSTAMGMHFVGPGDLLVHSRGPKGAALYRLTDTDGDDSADDLSMIMKSNGNIGEHGPHTILTGPDGFLYVLYGNHAHPQEIESPLSPVRNLQEDHLLPRYVDPRGHANRIRAPGGTMHRVNPQTGEWSQIVGGFRNPFDMGMNLEGEIFTFEADMEWDFGLPWFRPIRVVHAMPGADYGWRTGSSKMPFYYIDTLPSISDVGRGSPVGVSFYYHDTYPEKYRGAFFMGDWSRGRIRVLFPERNGGTYSGDTVDFVVGEPLNVTDMAVGPDGHLYFTTGGRGTHGGLYRVRYTGTSPAKETLSGTLAVLDQPMPRSAWGKEAIKAVQEVTSPAVWAKALRGAVTDRALSSEQRLRALETLQIYGPKPSVDELTELLTARDRMVRAAAVFLLGTFPLENIREPLTQALDDKDPLVARRACEALVRAGLDSKSMVATSKQLRQRLLMLLNNKDRNVRYAARQALARTHKDVWPAGVMSDSLEKRPRGALEGLLVLVNTQDTASDSSAIFSKLASYSEVEMDADTLLNYLRVMSLAFIRDVALEERAKNDDTDPRAAFKEAIGPRLLAQFPHEDKRVNRELQVALAYMNTPGAQDAILDYLTVDKTQEEQIHTVYCLRVMKEGWTREQRDRLVEWFDFGRDMGGAASMAGYVQGMWDATLELMEGDELELAKGRYDDAMQARQDRAIALLADIDGAKANTDLAQMSFEELADYLEYDPMTYRTPDYRTGERVFRKAKCAECHVYGSVGTGGGPDLSTVTSRFRRRDILESIMYPSRIVSDQYAALNLELDDLSEVTGMIAAEDDSSLTLITIHGERVDVQKSEIETRRDAEISMMPEGLLNTMSLGELVQLMHFLERGEEF